MERALTDNDKIAINALDDYKKEIPNLGTNERYNSWKSKVESSLEEWLDSNSTLVIDLKKAPNINFN